MWMNVCLCQSLSLFVGVYGWVNACRCVRVYGWTWVWTLLCLASMLLLAGRSSAPCPSGLWVPWGSGVGPDVLAWVVACSPRGCGSGWLCPLRCVCVWGGPCGVSGTSWAPGVLLPACAGGWPLGEGWLPVASGSLRSLPLIWRGFIWDLPLPSAGVGMRLALGCVATGLQCS